MSRRTMGRSVIMRYSVMFDEVAEAWAVVDTEAAGLTLAFHPTEEAAARAAAFENGRGPDIPAAE